MISFLSKVMIIAATACVSFTTAAFADEIHAERYDYAYGDTVKGMPDDGVFVVCNNCKTDKLVAMPTRQVVAINMGVDGPQPPPIEANSQNEQPSAVVTPVDTCGPSCLLGTVLFKFDSDRLTKTGRTTLDAIAGKVPTGKTVSVSGYTCTIGTKHYNQKLSIRRAKRVAAYLRHKGVNISGVQGHGECCPASLLNKRLNRRAEIIEKEKN